MTKVVAFSTGVARGRLRWPAGRPLRGATAGPEAPRRAGGSRGRDEIASVEKSSIPYLVVGRERHILGL